MYSHALQRCSRVRFRVVNCSSSTTISTGLGRAIRAFASETTLVVGDLDHLGGLDNLDVLLLLLLLRQLNFSRVARNLGSLNFVPEARTIVGGGHADSNCCCGEHRSDTRHRWPRGGSNDIVCMHATAAYQPH